MKTTHVIRWLVAGALTVGGLVVGCTYSPNFRDGALKCSPDGQCPRGYVCSSALTCCMDSTCGGTILPDAGSPGNTGGSTIGHLGTGGVTVTPGSGGTSTTGTGGHGGQPGTSTGGTVSTRTQDYVGVWTFASSATVTTTCDNPKSASNVLPFASGTTLTIQDNGDGTLNGIWSEWPDSPYALTIDSTGAHGTDAESWYYYYLDSDPEEYWEYQTFDVVSANGTTATHDATYQREDDWSDGTMVYCSQTVHAPMTKN